MARTVSGRVAIELSGGDQEVTHKDVSDAEIFRMAQRGDPLGMRAIYERYFPSIWRFVRSDLADEQATQDVVSETFLAAVQAVNTTHLNGPNLGNWLFGIARNKLSDFWRRRRRDDRLRAGAAQHKEIYDSQPPDAGLVHAELRERLAAAMRTLPDEERVALEWKYLEGFSVSQIAMRLGRTDKAVEAILYRARRVVRACLGPEEVA